MKKWHVLNQIANQKVVAVLRGNSAEQVEQFANSCIQGGVKAIEITFTVPQALRCIERLAEQYADDDEVVIGAGTVLDAETARLAILAGAQFVVTPYLNEEVIKVCHRYQVPVMPGVMTIKDVVAALESGADIIKLFPGEMAGPKMISAIKGPIPQASLMPTGGVNLENIQEWFAAGAIAVGIGGDLTREALKTGNYDSIMEKAQAYKAKAAEC
ncbi:bifunctional 2-keto-4-hydroxyglutarate aldolase/2-keto-3-deoxy-6-phosphogluconate aldolase [Fodinisporobacter ferrooxydans]|uniref:Bifunctional 2-keto-4-hydroxyglutarate aldolase/2-keto-3-deoxy-6-phosphogluconate aldolase n=1 Tax=Fodinisporobacter ferrooxydans TaxID=2901836 RepID=A0ABY4CIG5_9BACL|nr:bifunctional 2-keto-4-hydroxyglutarate aldolase/2-keto-3-deoxy-6-phosphogluconate aldolase [Alicyclobacillaceae bacterium MYW30-H2]